MTNFFKTVLFFSLLLSSQLLWAAPRLGRYLPGEILVKFKPKFTNANINAKIKDKGDMKLASLNAKGLSRIKLGPNRDFQAALAEYANNPDVEYAQPNFLYKISTTTPNDTRYSQMWGLKNTGQTIVSAGGPNTPRSEGNPGTSGKDMGLEYAWDYITNCSSIIVAVIDSGVNYNQEDLAANMWDGGGSYPKHGYDFVNNTDDPMDQNGHGTHVAGTIGAVGNNSLGSTGVCWTARIMALRVMDATGSGTTADIVQGVDFAVTNGAKVINMSIGGSSYDAAYNTAITNAKSSGVVVVVAAGNEASNNDSGTTPTYPCNYNQDNVLCVAALNQDYSLASYSNYGTTSVDIGAPGTNVVSSWPGTHTTLSDSLDTGWNFSSSTTSNWGYKTLGYSSYPKCLVNPTTYNYSSAKYANSTRDLAWKAFNTNGANVTLLDFYIMHNLEENKDYVSIYTKGGTGDPTSGGTDLGYVTGSSGGGRYGVTLDLTSYIAATTSVGFLFESDSSGVDFGTNISVFSLTNLTYNTNTYNVISGTSMATPHVSGLAAMIYAYNPNFTYTDVINAIKNGGVATSSLSGKTTTGKSASAIGALTYINAPTGVAAAIVP